MRRVWCSSTHSSVKISLTPKRRAWFLLQQLRNFCLGILIEFGKVRYEKKLIDSIENVWLTHVSYSFIKYYCPYVKNTYILPQKAVLLSILWCFQSFLPSNFWALPRDHHPVHVCSLKKLRKRRFSLAVTNGISDKWHRRPHFYTQFTPTHVKAFELFKKMTWKSHIWS